MMRKGTTRRGSLFVLSHPPHHDVSYDAVPAQPASGYHIAVTFSKLTSSTKISARSARNIFLLGLPGKWQRYRHADTNLNPRYVHVNIV
jgi:hypothetical protein